MMRSKATEKSVSKILGKTKAKYYDAARSDVINLLRTYRGLSPNLDTFVYDNGDERRLANVSGTIPVVYKEKTYNIPICIWLKIDHPNSSPMAFVTPTKDMQVKVSHHVDQTGRIYMQYLEDWRYPDSTLTGLINICREHFGELPPVFAKSKSTSSHNAVSDNIQNGNETSANGSLDDRRNSSNGSSALVSSTLNQHTPRSNSLSFDPENTNTNPNQNTHEYDDSPSCQANDDITDEEIRITLISSVEDKLKSKMEEEVSKTQAEIQCLHHTNRELLDRQEDICKIGKDLDEQLSNLTQYTDDLQSCENELQLAITDLEQKLKPIGEVDVDKDDIVGVYHPIHQQILNCQVEDWAIDDAIYILGDALRQGVISSEIYLKRVRNFSRKQFYTRALMEKCRDVSGLNITDQTDDSSS